MPQCYHWWQRFFTVAESSSCFSPASQHACTLLYYQNACCATRAPAWRPGLRSRGPTTHSISGCYKTNSGPCTSKPENTLLPTRSSDFSETYAGCKVGLRLISSSGNVYLLYMYTHVVMYICLRYTCINAQISMKPSVHLYLCLYVLYVTM